MYQSKSLKLLIALGLLTASQILSPSPAAAAPACDPKIMEALNARAWREAQREVMVNETFIYKPDSVFALSCFSSALGNTPSGFSSGSPQSAANSALNSYMNNFAHGFLGASGGGNQPTNGCTRMRELWGQAHCFNLAYSSPTSNVFTTFAYNMGSEPRMAYPSNSGPTYPSACTNASSWGATNTLINTKVAAQRVGATYDDANMFLRVTDPLASLTASTTCNPGILTGVEIGAGSVTYSEKVCPNPGCVPKFVSGGMKCCDQTNLNNRCEP